MPIYTDFPGSHPVLLPKLAPKPAPAFVIESGIPFPEEANGAMAGLTETLRLMKVDDSVFLTGREDTKLGMYWRRLAPKSFTARKTLGGVRVWRTG